ncbi:hypothetical protein ABIA39_000546 [Nocardia sp. GAS34]
MESMSLVCFVIIVGAPHAPGPEGLRPPRTPRFPLGT